MIRHALPPIESWWPRLGTAARHSVLSGLDMPIDAAVLAEIERITGTPIGVGARLDEHEISFIRTQQEPVD